MKFKTKSGSRYELDIDGKRIRRLGGVKEPTHRQGVDGEWRSYEALGFLGYVDKEPQFVCIGFPVIVCWSIGKGAVSVDKCTVTSEVVEIEP